FIILLVLVALMFRSIANRRALQEMEQISREEHLARIYGDALKTLDDIHAWALAHFTYEHDIDKHGEWEHWGSPDELIAMLAADGKVTGDCDDFALICRQILRFKNIPSRLVVCLAENGGGHLVCSPEGTGMVLDNRFERVMRRDELEHLGYQWVSMSGLERGEPWVKIGNISDRF
ncbi:MAG: hypothetical protein E6R03_11695, partial [Hyphomicrobiaceae bacterium]